MAERRVDKDGRAYTLEEFRDCYHERADSVWAQRPLFLSQSSAAQPAVEAILNAYILNANEAYTKLYFASLKEAADEKAAKAMNKKAVMK